MTIKIVTYRGGPRDGAVVIYNGNPPYYKSGGRTRDRRYVALYQLRVLSEVSASFDFVGYEPAAP